MTWGDERRQAADRAQPVVRPGSWAEAAERADRIAAFGHHPADSWDGRAIRGVLAVALAGLAVRQDRAVAGVDVGGVLWHLGRGPEAVYELGGELGLAAEGAEPDAAAAEWAWLVRRWPTAPALANSDGLARGIGRGSPLPAIDVATGWACTVAQAALAAERPAGLAPRTRVRVVSGEDKGRSGVVVAAAWLMDDGHRTVLPGPPPGYEVRIAGPGLSGEHVIVRADDLEEREPVRGPASP